MLESPPRPQLRETPVQMHVRDGGASSITSVKSAYYMVKVLLALFIGLARKPAGRRPRRPGARLRRVTGSRSRWTASSSSPSSPPPASAVRAQRAGAPAPSAGALRAAVAAGRDRRAGAGRVAPRRWRSLARAFGIIDAPNALFFVALGFGRLVLLLHLDRLVSRLSDQSKLLAQRLALLEERAARGAPRAGDG